MGYSTFRNPSSAPEAEIRLYTRSVMRKLMLFSLLALLAVAACHKSAESARVKVYKLHGKVVSIDAAKGEVTVDHEAIAGFMEAMTMPYKAKDAAALTSLNPGDIITADVLVPEDQNAEMLLDHIVVVGQVRPSKNPAVSQVSGAFRWQKIPA